MLYATAKLEGERRHGVHVEDGWLALPCAKPTSGGGRTTTRKEAAA
jgi:hypothetical protein